MALPEPPTALIGRAAELAALTRAFAVPRSRLLTLTGPPGVGKTRLALAAAAALEGFSDGKAFVDLTSAPDPDAVIAEIARALGVGEAPDRPLIRRLIASLADQKLLLVLDNCEHVIEAGSDLAALVAGCPRLWILTTSRERFRLASEREFPVPPLAMPERADVSDRERLAANPSVALLLARTRAVLPDFALTTRNAAAIAEVCVRLDGLPLALELAAASLKLFTPQELAIRLGQRMRLLTGGARDVPARHRTLRAAIGWSHDLLSPPEQLLFRRLSVFVRGWRLEAAEQVCPEPGLDVLAATASLVDKSMLRRSIRPDETAQFSMLESLREFAVEQLAASGELQVTRSRHAAYFADLAIRAEAGIGTSDETFWWDWVGHERGNLRAALDHCLAAGDIGPALCTVAALGWFWYTRGYLGEGQVEVDRVLAAAESTARPLPDDAVSGALLASGFLACGRGDLDHAEVMLRRSVVASESAADPRRTAIATAFLGQVARARGHYDEALACHRRAHRLYEELGSPRGMAWALHDLGLLARDRGDLGEAARLLGDSLHRFQDLGYPWAIAWSSWALGTVLLGEAQPEEAAALLLRALDGYEATDDRRGIAQCFEALADVASAQRSHDAAARLLGAAWALRQALAAPLPPADEENRDRVEASVRGALPGDSFASARRAGRTMPLSAAIELARTVRPHTPSPPEAISLTRREREVAALVATGATNRQIGRALGIAEKTAEVHVRNIMGKLDARGRAEVAGWAVAQGLHSPTGS